ncbi:alpha/beta hydrolase family protein [Anseongella ginsenosidimutans]|uniref:alpha/beta hydrolase family protein n=1 Tax=Anseongella ginsenosidimutans TaxID=496056 RepID=UPI0021D2A65A|nr:acetylxylan esterase [Anseongella ginsenosidimutans]
MLFESRPDFYVTSSLYIPKGIDKPAPAILYCSGHSALGYRSPVYQHVIINLVKKGFIVFAFDPVGQGERIQYYDPNTGQSRMGGPTREHSYPSVQLLLAGTNLVNYMVWDGIRALDYLATRPEVDINRIGVTGRSGGGTQAAYLGAVDDRVKAAAIENYLTSFARLYESKGPQDAEQNLTHGILKGIDHADLLIARLPKASLLIATTNDFFSIQGARETFEQVSTLAKLYPFAQDKLFMVEDDAGHASTRKNREALYAFFQSQLELPGPVTDLEITVPAAAELRVCASGQVSTSTPSENLFSLNKKHASTIQPTFPKHPLSLPDVSFIKELVGFNQPLDTVNNVFTGRVARKGYVIEKYFTYSSGGYLIPYLYFKPELPNGKALIYVHPEGKESMALPGSELERMVQSGYAVFCPDLIGIGEMGPGSYKGDAYIDGVSYNMCFMGLQINKTVVGLRSSDIVALRQVITRAFLFDDIYAISVDELASPLLHAALFDEAIKGVLTIGDFATYSTLVNTEYYDSRHAFSLVPNVLLYYDLPILTRAIAPRKYAHLDGKGAGPAILAKIKGFSAK